MEITQIHLETTNFCPHKCVFCPNSVLDIKPEFIEFNTFKNIVDEVIKAGISNIALSGRLGEFVLHPEWKEQIMYLENLSEINSVSFFSNLITLTENHVHFINKLKKTTAKISINGLTDDEFMRLNAVKTKLSDKLPLFSMMKTSAYSLFISGPREKTPLIMRTFKHQYRIKKSNWGGLIDNGLYTKKKCELLKKENGITMHGDFILCGCRDVYGVTKIGNIFETPILELMHSDKYNIIPELCKKCNGSGGN